MFAERANQHIYELCTSILWQIIYGPKWIFILIRSCGWQARVDCRGFPGWKRPAHQLSRENPRTLMRQRKMTLNARLRIYGKALSIWIRIQFALKITFSRLYYFPCVPWVGLANTQFYFAETSVCFSLSLSFSHSLTALARESIKIIVNISSHRAAAIWMNSCRFLALRVMLFTFIMLILHISRQPLI